MTELWEQSATELAQLVTSKKVSAQESVEAAIQRMESLDSEYRAVAIPCVESARQQAAELDQRIAQGEKVGSLAGVPVTVKVNIDQAGFANTNGLRIQKDLVADKDSPVVANLKRADAIIIGRTNTPAFSMRWFTRNSLHGHTLNPLNPALTPGGSSGGAASAVASGIGALAHGTDIAGSIRYPAYACGVHGLRPSLGRVPAHNWSLPDRYLGGQLMAVSGPLARTMDDLALGFSAMAGGTSIANAGDAINKADIWWAPVPLELPAPAKRAAVVEQPKGHPAVHKPLLDALHQAADKLSNAGWEVESVECPSFEEAAELNIRLWMEEMAKVRESVAKEDDPDASFVFAQLEAQAKQRNTASVLDLFQARATLTREWFSFLDQYPVVLCPPSAELPFPDQLDVASEEAFLRVFDAQLTQIGLPLMGIPGLCVTTGHVNDKKAEFNDAQGIKPVGVQVIASRYREDVLIEVGKLLEGPVAVVGSPPSS